MPSILIPYQRAGIDSALLRFPTNLIRIETISPQHCIEERHKSSQLAHCTGSSLVHILYQRQKVHSLIAVVFMQILLPPWVFIALQLREYSHSLFTLHQLSNSKDRTASVPPHFPLKISHSSPSETTAYVLVLLFDHHTPSPPALHEASMARTSPTPKGGVFSNKRIAAAEARANKAQKKTPTSDFVYPDVLQECDIEDMTGMTVDVPSRDFSVGSNRVVSSGTSKSLTLLQRLEHWIEGWPETRDVFDAGIERIRRSELNANVGAWLDGHNGAYADLPSRHVSGETDRSISLGSWKDLSPLECVQTLIRGDQEALDMIDAAIDRVDRVEPTETTSRNVSGETDRSISLGSWKDLTLLECVRISIREDQETLDVLDAAIDRMKPTEDGSEDQAGKVDSAVDADSDSDTGSVIHHELDDETAHACRYPNYPCSFHTLEEHDVPQDQRQVLWTFTDDELRM